jgi:hypothetical protein
MGEFLAELIFRTLTAVGIGRATACRKKLPHYLLGCFSIFISGLCLLWYYLYPPVPREQFQAIRISYSNCVAEGSRDDRRIVLKSGDKDYVLQYWLWKKRHKEAEVVAALKQSSEALVWLATSENHDLRGLETATFRIDPSVGAEWDRSNRNAARWLSAGFFGAGLLLIAVVRYSKTGYDRETNQ